MSFPLLTMDDCKIVKIRYVNDGEIFSRKLLINKNTRLKEFHEKIRLRFDISPDVETEIYYRDEDNDLVIVTFDDEFLIAIKSKSQIKFELVNSILDSNNLSEQNVIETEASKVVEASNNTPPKVVETSKDIISRDVRVKRTRRFIKAKIMYCGGLCGKVGDYNEIIFKSSDLTIDKAIKGRAWGTKIYTSDSNFLKALIHSHPIKLTNTPPPYDIIAIVKLLPGQSSYLGSTINGVNTNDYGKWGLSYSIEDFRYESIQFSQEEISDRKSKVKKI